MRKPFGEEQYGFWMEKLKGVEIDRHQPVIAGWVLYSGCEGEDPSFVGFFAKRESAALMLSLKNEDGEPLFFDTCIVPGVILGDRMVSTGLYSGNHFSDALSIEALSKRFEVDAGRWGKEYEVEGQ